MFNYIISKITDDYFIKNQIFPVHRYYDDVEVYRCDEFYVTINYDDNDFIFLLGLEHPLIRCFDDLIDSKIVINCSTKEDAMSFMELCFCHKVQWWGYEENCKSSLIEQWDKYKGQTCYVVFTSDDTLFVDSLDLDTFVIKDNKIILDMCDFEKMINKKGG